MRIKMINGLDGGKSLFKGQNKNNHTKIKEKTLAGQPIKRPLFK